MGTELSVVGLIPHQHPAESSQFERVLRILKEAKAQIGEWVVIVLDVPCHHEAGELIDIDTAWDTQIDILVMAEHRIITYELKGFTAQIIYGKTDDRPWKIKRWNSDTPDQVRSYFQQASKHHAFLVRDFLAKYREADSRIEENHWIVDSRVVLKSESDLSGFFYRIPRTISQESFETEVIALISDPDDVALLRNLYSGREEGTNKLRSVRVSEDEYRRAVDVCRENGIMPRTAKWFRLLKEDQLRSDISRTGSNRFTLLRDSALRIANMLKAQ